LITIVAPKSRSPIATKFQRNPKHLLHQNEEPIHVREVLRWGRTHDPPSGEFSMGTDQNRPGQQGGQQGQRGGQGQQSGQGSQQGRPGQGGQQGQQKPGQQQGGQRKDMDD
jgi:hypothetical protein